MWFHYVNNWVVLSSCCTWYLSAVDIWRFFSFFHLIFWNVFHYEWKMDTCLIFKVFLKEDYIANKKRKLHIFDVIFPCWWYGLGGRSELHRVSNLTWQGFYSWILLLLTLTLLSVVGICFTCHWPGLRLVSCHCLQEFRCQMVPFYMLIISPDYNFTSFHKHRTLPNDWRVLLKGELRDLHHPRLPSFLTSLPPLLIGYFFFWWGKQFHWQ